MTQGKFDSIYVRCDASWDVRSTTGVRVVVDDFKIHSLCQTQTGLPSLSSGESELRSLSAGAQLGLYVQTVFGEFGHDMKLYLGSDASAALANASKLGPGRLKHVDRLALFVKE
eukprot:7597399-Lingulodinium_polyedra.AAC.1